MIRIALVLAGFIAVNIALIAVLTANGPRRDLAQSGGIDGVTRMQAGLDPDGFRDEALGPDPVPVTAPDHDTALPRDDNGAGAAGTPPRLELLIIAALEQGKSEIQLDEVATRAVARGGGDVPQNLMSADGRVDTAPLLAMLGTNRQHTDALAPGPRHHIVRPGDTLESISYRFYGQTGREDHIRDANRDILSGSGALEPGLRLVVPEQ